MMSLRASRRAATSALVALSVATGTARTQIADQVVLFGVDKQFADHIARFDRKLHLLGLTKTGGVGAGGGILDDFAGVAVDAQGRYWVPFDALNDTKVLRMESDGTLILPSTNLQHNANYLVTTPSSVTYVLTRIPLTAAGPLYALDADGAVLWTNPAGPALFSHYPQTLDMTPNGELWIGGASGNPTLPRLVRVDPGSGAVLDVKTYTQQGFGVSEIGPDAAPDGTFWTFFDNQLTHLVALQVAQQAQYPAYAWYPRIDAAGNIVLRMVDKPAPYQTDKLLRLDGRTLAVIGEYPLGGATTQYPFALGPSGEDVYVSGGYPPNYTPCLWRVNLATGTKSSVGLDGISWEMTRGDPTGFIWANVRDQQGDADGDGAANRAETLAGSDPFDPTSRPEGPKVYISFAPTTNALVLTWVDPDGLLDPVGGLDLSTLSVTIGNYGNVFWLLAPFATALDLSPDMKKATLTFGALPLPSDKKWQVEATIADLTGATGWDWQVTPPGDL
jgi:hypothetical protein